MGFIMKKVVLAAAIAAISSGALAQTSIPVNVSGLVVPAQEAPEVPEGEKNCTVSSDSGSINLAFNNVEKGTEATSESDSLTVSECSGATVSLSTTEDGPQSDTISGSIVVSGSEPKDVEIPLDARVAGTGVNLFEQGAEVESDSTEIEVTASLTAEQTSEEGAIFAQGMVYVTIDGADTPAPDQTPVEQVTSAIGGSAIGGIVPTAPSVEPEEGVALVGAVVDDAVDAVSGVVEAVISQFSSSDLPELGAGDLPELGAGDLPELGAGDLPELGAGDLPELGAGDLPELGAGDLPELGAGDLPELGAGDFPELGAGDLPELGAGDLPELGAGDLPELGAGDFPELGAGDLPEFGTGDAPELGAGDAPELGAVDLPELGAGDVPELGAGDAPELGAGDVPELGAGDVPELGAGDLPEFGDRELPQTIGEEISDRLTVEADRESGSGEASLEV